MNDAMVMSCDQALYDLKGVIDSMPSRQCAFRQPRAQSFTVQQFANNVRRSVVETDIIDGDDVGMIESGCGAGFQFEAAETIGIAAGTGTNEFQGNIAAQPLVTGPIDFAHRSGADFFEDPVVTYDPVFHSE